MAVDYTQYPKNWKELSNYIRFDRAASKCERCPIEHGKIYDIQTRQLIENQPFTSRKELKKNGLILIALATAHINHDTTDNRENNLLALCPFCHLAHDISHRANSKKYGKYYRDGQGTLF